MTEDKSDRSKRINAEFERHLPVIWRRARMNEHQMEKEYIMKLRTESSTRRSEEVVFTIEQCVMCGSHDVPNKTLEIPVNINGIVSVSINGAKCSNPNCLEEYYNSNDTETIRAIEYLLNMRLNHRQIKKLHLQSDEYRAQSARAARNEDDFEE